MEDDLLFIVTDPLKRQVGLSNERYKHILEESGHTEVSPLNISKTLENPELIFKGNIDNTRVYFARGNSDYPKLYTTVVTAEYTDLDDVRTAYIRPDVGGQIVPASNEGCLYINVDNKL